MVRFVFATLISLILFTPALEAQETCRGLIPTIVGTDGNDQLQGTAGNDVIVGHGGNDTISGEGGDDVLCGGPGIDAIFGGAGNDYISGGEDNDTLHGGEGDDIIDGGTGKNNTIHGDEGFDICTNGKPHKCESSSINRAPIADAGYDQTTRPGVEVTLDGSGSSDPDGDLLTFLWSFESFPAGAAPVFSDPTALRPTLTVFTPGEYLIRLVVRDHDMSSEPDTVILTTVNSRPLANAGPNQTTRVTRRVTLDGSGSSDADGDPLTFRWSLAVPAESTAQLNDVTALMPTFDVDKPGRYDATLIVRDGFADSDPSMVSVNTENTPPVAHAGPAQSVFVNTEVRLDGTASSDVDGDPLSYQWALTTVPAGSHAALSSTTVPMPRFTVDLPGTYVAQLIVNDGTADSDDASTVMITTLNSRPVAEAGEAQSVFVGDIVHLNGGASSDADRDPLSYRWSLTVRPAESNAILENPDTQTPRFQVDRPGTYVAQLIVNDGTLDSDPDTVTITTLNSRPVANAGGDQTPFVGEMMTLQGSGTDADFDALTFQWSLTTPPLSTTTLENSTTAAPRFLVDRPGTYVAQLIVSDGTLDSEPDTANITTQNSRPLANAGEDQSPFVGTTVTLQGSGTDADFDALSFSWTLTVPPGSSATLEDPTSATPRFLVDRPGTYSAELIVNDGTINSLADTVLIITQNSAPVADAGADQSPFVGTTVTLQGSGTDADFDTLSFTWTLSVPTGSTTTLENPTTANPRFLVDRPGTYTASLVVNDGTVDSPADTVLIITQNSAPVANAGEDQSPFVGDTVTLNGSGTDADFDSLTFSWTLAVPAGSTTTLENANTDSPRFLVDRPGTYSAELIVNDGTVNSLTDVVLIITQNSRPVANAGEDQSPFVGDTVTLQGSGTDADFDSLTFHWTLTVPPASNATLTNPNSASPSFEVDRPGTYTASLIVNDGTADSVADTVLIITQNSAPVAHAGEDQSPFVGDTVTLNGSGTDADFDSLTFSWTLTVPAGSTAVLENANTASPRFVVDRPGTYTAELIVNDGTVNSVADVVLIITQNSRPVANAGADQFPFVGATITLQGSGTDADFDPLTFTWTLSVPAGSNASLNDPNSATPQFSVDRPGTYTASLVVNDGTLDSLADIVLVVTRNSTPTANAGDDQLGLFVGATVTLQGSGSDADFDTLTFRWTLTRPAGSNATLDQPNSASPRFMIDKVGMYEATLVVNDGTTDSLADSVVITALNRPPTANAGPDQNVEAGTRVTLNGSGADPDGDVVMLQWALTTVPPGSAAVLSDPSSASPFFDADLAGEYIARLTPFDGTEQGAPDFVSIIATPQQIDLILLGTPFLGVGRTAQLQVVLPQPAPLGGVTVTVTSDMPSRLTVVEPGTVFIAEGQLTGIITASGVTPGDATLRANAPGYNEGTATLTVTDKLVNLPDAFSVPLGRTANLVVSISPNPAPATGLIIRLTTSDENVIAVSASVTILPGQFSATAIVTGVRPGTATVTAENPDFATDSTPVSTAAQLNITVTSVTFNAGFPASFTVQLQSSGSTAQAPSPGVTVTLTSSNPGCATTPSATVLIATGLINVTSQVIYGGTAALPCTATITATSPGITQDTVAITVNPKPNIGLTLDLPQIIGTGLRSGNVRASLGNSQHGNSTVIRIRSEHPHIAKVSRDVNTPGTDFVDIPIANGATIVNFIIQAMEGDAALGVATITAEEHVEPPAEPRFNPGSSTVTVVRAAIRLNLSTATIDTLDPNRAFTVSIGRPNGTGISGQQIRPGGTTVEVTVTSSNPAVADLIFGTGAAAGSIVAPITAGNHTTPNIQLRPRIAGTTTITISAPGVTTQPTGTVTITVTKPSIVLAPGLDLPQTIGTGLRTANVRAALTASQHGTSTVIRIRSEHPHIAKVSPNTTTPGTDFIDIPLANGSTTVNFIVQGMEGDSAIGTATITASDLTVAPMEPRFNPGSSTVTVVKAAIRLNLNNTALDTLDPNRAFTVSIGRPNGTGISGQQIRPGGTTVNVTVTSSNPAAADLIFGSNPPSDSVIVPITEGNHTSANIQLRPRTAGSTTISISAPGVTTQPTGFVTVPVTKPSIVLAPGLDLPQTIGTGLRTGNVRAALTASQHGSSTVIRVRSEHPHIAKVSPNSTTPGTDFIDVPLANGSTTVNFVVHAMEGTGAIGTATITASDLTVPPIEPRFNPGSSTVTVVQSAITLSLSTAPIDTLDPNRPFNVVIGRPNGNGVTGQPIRPGGPTVNVTVTSSNPAVADLVFPVGPPAGTPAGSVLVPITAGTTTSPSIQLRPRTAGFTTISISAPGQTVQPFGVLTIQVTRPAISLDPDLPGGSSVTVGAGLTSGNIRAFLGASQHGGATVKIESSNPAIALIAPNSTTAGSTFILVPLVNGAIQANFMVQGVEGAEGDVIITVSCDRFSDAQGAANIVPAAVRFNGLSATATAGGVADLFNIQVGVANADGSNLSVQSVRTRPAEMPPFTFTITSANPAVAGLVSGSSTVGSLEVPIAATQNTSANVSLRPLSAGSSLLRVTGPDVTTTGAGQVNVTVNP